MNIIPVNFKGITRFGYDDSFSVEQRKRMRENIYKKNFESEDVFVKNPRLEEYELNKLIESLAKKGNTQKEKDKKIDSEKLEELVYNVRPIKGTSNYTGATYCITGDDRSKKLKEAGVNKIIFLRHNSYDKKALASAGIKTSSYFVDSEIWDELAFQSKRDTLVKAKSFFRHYDTMPYKEDEILDKWNKEKRPFIDEFTNFIKDMQGDNILVGCSFGVERITDFLLLNYFFNPKASYIKRLSRIQDKNELGQKIKNLYENLTPEDKKKMGWDNNFDENFIPRLEKWTDGAKNLE